MGEGAGTSIFIGSSAAAGVDFAVSTRFGTCFEAGFGVSRTTGGTTTGGSSATANGVATGSGRNACSVVFEVISTVPGLVFETAR